ncbi:hypothetical protein D9M69_319170 [compost metagenome]
MLVQQQAVGGVFETDFRGAGEGEALVVQAPQPERRALGRHLLANPLQIDRRQAGERLGGLLAVCLRGQPRLALQFAGDAGEHLGVGARLGEPGRQRLQQPRLVDLPLCRGHLVLAGRGWLQEFLGIHREQHRGGQVGRAGGALRRLVAVHQQRQRVVVPRQAGGVGTLLAEQRVDLFLAGFTAGQGADLGHHRRVALAVEGGRQREHRVLDDRQRGRLEPVRVGRLLLRMATAEQQADEQQGQERSGFHGTPPIPAYQW